MDTNTAPFKPINADGFWNRQAARTGFTGYNDLVEPQETFTPSQSQTEPQGTWWHKPSQERGFEGYA